VTLIQLLILVSTALMDRIRVTVPDLCLAAMRNLPALLLIVVATAMAQSEIYRCAQEDGTVAFQQTPCEVASDQAADAAPDEQDAVEPDAASDPAPEPSAVFAEPADAPAAKPDESTAPLSEDRANCEKSARDAIDAIDLEMRKGYSREQGPAYRDQLLKLTQQLRDCKKLP